jgi:benzil reductase ((S)-benzoin forming)
MRYFIVTGCNRGLGLAITQHLLEHGETVLGVCRRHSEATQQFITQYPKQFLPHRIDLSDVANIEPAFLDCLREITWGAVEGAYLMNNAGVIEPIEKVGRYRTEEIVNSVTVNLMAPMILTNTFVQQFSDYRFDKRVLNISSGAGQKPYQGWSAYCAGKAGLDMYSRVMDAEQDSVRVASIAPGIVDTGMQETIRGSNDTAFPTHSEFVQIFESGGLAQASDVAGKLVAYLLDDAFGVPVVGRV